MCPECGPRPEFLFMYGVCIGISVDNIKNQKDSDLFLEYSEEKNLGCPRIQMQDVYNRKKE